MATYNLTSAFTASISKITLNTFAAYYLEAVVASTTAPTVIPTFTKDMAALVLFGFSIESKCFVPSIFNATCGEAERLAREQLDAARIMNLGAIVRSIRMTDL